MRLRRRVVLALSWCLCDEAAEEEEAGRGRDLVVEEAVEKKQSTRGWLSTWRAKPPAVAPASTLESKFVFPLIFVFVFDFDFDFVLFGVRTWALRGRVLSNSMGIPEVLLFVGRTRGWRWT